MNETGRLVGLMAMGAMTPTDATELIIEISENFRMMRDMTGLDQGRVSG